MRYERGIGKFFLGGGVGSVGVTGGKGWKGDAN